MSTSASSGWASWARAWRRTLRAPASTSRSGTAPRRRRRAWSETNGGRVAASPREAAKQADAVITMVVDGAQVEEVLLGEDGAVHDAEPGTLFVDMSTIAPADARAHRRSARRARHGFVDAPVTGSSPKAEDGTLTIMAGGSDEDFARARPLFDAMGEVILHVGPLGHGQTVKVISNAVSATNCATLAQALVVGQGGGRRPRRARRRDGRRLGELDDGRAQGRADAGARLHAAVPARAHAQGRRVLPRGEHARPGRPSRRRPARASSTPPAWAAAWPTRTSPPCSRWSRAWPARGSDAASPADPARPRDNDICRKILGFCGDVHRMSPSSGGSEPGVGPRR